MDAINLIVHFVSGIAFVTIIYFFLQYRKYHHLTHSYLTLIHDDVKTQYVADDAVSFLKRFSKVMRIEFSIEGSQNKNLEKLNIVPWIKAHLNCGLTKIHCITNSDGLTILLSFRKNNDVSELRVEELKASLGKLATIKLS